MKHAESSALFPWMCQMSPRSTNTYSSLLIALGIWMNKNFLLLTRETKAEKPLEKRGPLCDLKDRKKHLSFCWYLSSSQPCIICALTTKVKARPLIAVPVSSPYPGSLFYRANKARKKEFLSSKALTLSVTFKIKLNKKRDIF